jgi:hypothetical protein
MIEVEKLAKENRFDYLLVKARNQWTYSQLKRFHLNEEENIDFLNLVYRYDGHRSRCL